MSFLLIVMKIVYLVSTKSKNWLQQGNPLFYSSMDVPIADAERGNFPCPFIYTNNISLWESCSQEDFWIDNSSRPWISESLSFASVTDHFCNFKETKEWVNITLFKDNSQLRDMNLWNILQVIQNQNLGIHDAKETR